MKNDILYKFKFNTKNEAISFHEHTNLKRFIKDKKNFDAPNEWTVTQYKGYPRFKKIKLPKPKPLTKKLTTVMMQRKSIRTYLPKPVALKDLSTFLYYSVGIKDKKKDTENRFYPSAGSRYPLEIYLIVQNCENLKKGIYHYHVKSHSLEYLWDIKKTDVKRNFKHEWVKDSPFIILVTAVMFRNMIKYSDRGYRHILMEAGIVTENFYLISTALNLGCCAMGGFLDEGLEKLLDIDKFEEKMIICIASGYKA